MSLQIAFIATFGVIALIISMIAGFMVGNRIGYIISISMISTLAFCILGFGVHQVLATRVPEFLTFLGNLMGIFTEAAESAAGSGGLSMSTSDLSDNEIGSSSNSNFDDDLDVKTKVMGQGKSGKFGDHLVVENIALKNEPKLMAEAIRTMMARDED
ncbi:hypothetical protein [Leptospira sp. GIMC2001]|uniref:hypothetical protein n=1 Tax=Leptospira sp. GIMC2001 TaxID=1513297 RepID=UPI002349C281|nr:hypothetical protein [Leptospira sp. GIMC2001]WCL48267.1 hypothetical protein O4O04_13235 [Leptospira sp. GIMC2001]